MTLLNYVLVGLLGTMLAISLYMTKHDFSRGSTLKTDTRILLA